AGIDGALYGGRMGSPFEDPGSVFRFDLGTHELATVATLDPGWGLYSVAALPGGQLLTLRSDGSTTGIAERLDPATGSFTVVAGFALGFAPGPLWPGRDGFYYAGAVSLQFGGPMLLQIDPNGGGSIPFGGFISGIVGPFDGIFYVTDASGL